jgi:hypothetical protein
MLELYQVSAILTNYRVGRYAFGTHAGNSTLAPLQSAQIRTWASSLAEGEPLSLFYISTQYRDNPTVSGGEGETVQFVGPHPTPIGTSQGLRLAG